MWDAVRIIPHICEVVTNDGSDLWGLCGGAEAGPLKPVMFRPIDKPSWMSQGVSPCATPEMCISTLFLLAVHRVITPFWIGLQSVCPFLLTRIRDLSEQRGSPTLYKSLHISSHSVCYRFYTQIGRIRLFFSSLFFRRNVFAHNAIIINSPSDSRSSPILLSHIYLHLSDQKTIYIYNIDNYIEKNLNIIIHIDRFNKIDVF